MTRAATPIAIEEIYQQELTRLGGFLVDVRAARAHHAVLPIALIAALRPTPLRVALLAAAAVGLIALSRTEQRRFQIVGFTPTFVTRNAIAMGALHLVIYLTTGALTSPFLPMMLVFSFGVAIVLGEDPSRRAFLAFQLSVIAALAVGQALHWSDALSPDWLRTDLGPMHTAFVGLSLGVFVQGACRVGLRMRRLFDNVVARVADTRHDILREHQSQAEELTALSAAIAHELKNPLASVKGLAGLLARDVPEGKPAERLGVLRREVDRMRTTLDEFLNFSRPALPASVDDIDLRELCADVCRLHEGLARDRSIRLSITGDGHARGDPRKTRQILINLLQNALHASPPGAEIGFHLQRGQGVSQVAVEDHGPGLDPTIQDRVFEAGVTTKERGSGLGLTIARALARQQSGDLALADRPGGGCRALLTLPAVAA